MVDDSDGIVRWVHDCEECVFLGSFPDDGVRYELYLCSRSRTGPTVIARYGDGPDYISGMALVDSVPALSEAKRRVVARGLLFST